MRCDHVVTWSLIMSFVDMNHRKVAGSLLDKSLKQTLLSWLWQHFPSVHHTVNTVTFLKSVIIEMIQFHHNLPQHVLDKWVYKYRLQLRNWVQNPNGLVKIIKICSCHVLPSGRTLMIALILFSTPGGFNDDFPYFCPQQLEEMKMKLLVNYFLSF